MIYLHVPFCGSFCTYCDFYSEIAPARGQERLFEDYADAVLAEIGTRREEIQMNRSADPAADTLYIGGGTPSVLPLFVLRRIAISLLSLLAAREQKSRPQPARRKGERCDDWRRGAPKPQALGTRLPWGNCEAAGGEGIDREFREFTVEVNPEDVVEKGPEYVRGLLELGVNRISMGVQSFDDGLLRWMNRRHNAVGAVRAYEMLRETAAECRKPLSVSIDLIFGVSGLTDDIWNDTLGQALALGRTSGLPRPDHISAYQLSIEEDSALGRMAAEGRYSEASEDDCRRQYDRLCRRLAEAGYRHYEISNFALPGHEAVHNSAYWRRVPYVGLGPGAHSFSVETDAAGHVREVRSWNDQILPCRLADGRLRTYSRKEETLSEEDIRIERLMLGLRTDRGLPQEELGSLADPAAIDRLLAEGALERAVGWIHIPEDRFFTSNEILRELL